MSIGEAAKLAGVSVQTLRHYDKLGLLVPSQLSAAGYRRYSQRDCERLHLIRALREVGFGLDTIAKVLDRRLPAGEAVCMRLEALEAEQRTLRRRQLLLRAVMNGNRRDMLARLQQKHVLAKLDRVEREGFLAKHLAWIPRDTPASQAVWRAAIFDLPVEMDDAQLEAWLELAEIVSDERFHRTLERQFQLTQGLAAPKVIEWNQTFQRLLADIIRTIRQQRTLDDEASRSLLDAWINGFARLHSRTPDAKFIRWLLERLESSYDVRIARYWELISRLKRTPYDPVYAEAFGWLLNALRNRVASQA